MNVTVLNGVPFFYLAAFAFSVACGVTGTIRLKKMVTLCWGTGFAFHTAGLLYRWVESYTLGIGHPPLSNFYESLVFFSWAVVFFYLVLGYFKKSDPLDSFILLAAFILIAFASFSPGIDSRIQPLIPALKSNWLISHVVTCLLGYGAFVIAAVMGAFLLIRRPDTIEREWLLEERIYQCMVIGFLFFTVGIMTGSVWAHYAWGRYWGWDPKETWALITWLIYAGTLHVRLRRRWTERGMAVMTLVGLASILFTFLGVNYLSGLHSYL